MQDNDSLDEMRQLIQESLIQAKREQLREEFGMQHDHMDSHLSLEGQNEWLDYLLDFERHFGNAPLITERERIGNPVILPLVEIPLRAFEDAVRLQPSPYFGWDVVYTSLLNDLLTVLC